MPLTSLFFDAAPASPQITDIAKAQLLVQTLGAVHAASNPLSFWQSIKAAFAFCGNRKGQLTGKLNERIFLAVEKACSAEVAATVKEHVLSRSAQVKSGITKAQGSAGGPKSYERFGKTELAAFVGVEAVEVCDLAALQPVSVAMNGVVLAGHQQTYAAQKQETEGLKWHAEMQIKEMVNAED